MKKIMLLILGLNISSLYTKTAFIDHKKTIRDNIAYLEEKGGKLSEQELEEIKKKAQEIIQPDEAKRLTYKVGMRMLEKSLLAESADHHIGDNVTPEDISVVLEATEYARKAVNAWADDVFITLSGIQEAQDFTTQLHHSLAYLLTLMLEVEKALEKIEFRVKANKSYDDASAVLKLHIAPADIIQHLYSINGGMYQKSSVV